MTGINGLGSAEVTLLATLAGILGAAFGYTRYGAYISRIVILSLLWRIAFAVIK